MRNLATPVSLATAAAAWRNWAGAILKLRPRRQSAQTPTTTPAVVPPPRLAEVDLLASVSHEIRTPMTAILGHIELVLDCLQDEQAIRSAQTIKYNSQILLGLVDDLLDLSRLEAGKFSIQRVECSPRQILAEVVELLRVRAQAYSLSLIVECAPDVPLNIHSDPTRLRQILINLVNNAIKFGDHHDVRVRVARVEQAQAATLRFDVVDQGVGLTGEQIAELFRPFVQAGPTSSGSFSGTGLGLAISKSLAELLGGSISVDSSPGRGSTFSLSIPLQAMSSAPQGPTLAAPSPDAAEAGSVSSLSVDLSGVKVLLAEDDASCREIAEFVLLRSGALVALAEDGQIAIRKARQAEAAGQPFDVLLLDLQMPTLDGYAASRQLRAAGYQGLIVGLTAHARAQVIEQCLVAGCNDCLEKPIDQALLREIARHLAARYGERQSAAHRPS